VEKILIDFSQLLALKVDDQKKDYTSKDPYQTPGVIGCQNIYQKVMWG
jgi:hypothetical protein